ncbi:MAG: DUF333 domain-containing protein [Patescibacteria group bacterium]|nr:DUF333 domain-containing protein [Patescibacteria group bacterium]
MKKLFIFTILIVSLVLSGCIRQVVKETPDESGAQLANPASQYCLEQGGELEIRENADGQYGVCKFSDGSECEEWAFFRKECQPGDKGEDTSDGSQQINSVLGNDKIKVFNIEDGQTVYSPLAVFGKASAEKDVLTVELRNNNHETLVKETVKIYNSGQTGEMGDYVINKLNFEFNNTKEGFVAVYEEGADGSELNLVEIPVKFDDSDISN